MIPIYIIDLLVCFISYMEPAWDKQFWFTSLKKHIFCSILTATTPRSQTYSANEVELILAVGETGETIEWVDIDPEAFTGKVHPHSNFQSTQFLPGLLCFQPSENGEWAIVHRPGRKMINTRYTKDDLEYQEILFNLVIQRKPLFYVVNIILPCSLVSSLVVLAYFLPAQGQ